MTLHSSIKTHGSLATVAAYASATSSSLHFPVIGRARREPPNLLTFYIYIIILPTIIIFPFFLFFSLTSCTLFPTNKPRHPQCRRIILEYEGALYQVEVEVEEHYSFKTQTFQHLNLVNTGTFVNFDIAFRHFQSLVW